jgi:hypothetical protein
LAIEPDEKTYRLLPEKDIFLVDHHDEISPEKHLSDETDIALCLNESKAQGKFFPVGRASASAVLHVPVLTKIDLLDDRALISRAEEVKQYYGKTPLLVAAPTRQGCDDLRHWILDGSRFYD